MEGNKKGQKPMYIGLFASNPAETAKKVKETCKQAILNCLQHVNPEGYLPEGQKLEQSEHSHIKQRKLTEAQIAVIQKDFADFDGFSTPKDNYHMTSLFFQKNLNPNEKSCMNNWKNGRQHPLKVDFIVYIPNYMMAGSISDLGKIEVTNKCPHMTLLLKKIAKAKHSNDILQQLLKKASEIFQKRHKKVIVLDIPCEQVGSEIIIVVDLSFEVKGVTGDNLSHGKK